MTLRTIATICCRWMLVAAVCVPAAGASADEPLHVELDFGGGVFKSRLPHGTPFIIDVVIDERFTPLKTAAGLDAR